MKFKNVFSSKWIRPCTICGCVVRVDDFFCEECLLLYLKSKKESWPCCNHHLLFEHVYILKWLKDLEFLNSFVRCLKGTNNKAFLFQFLANEFYGKNCRIEDFKKVIWVPAPAKLHKSHDHAYQLATGLQKRFGGEIHNVLKRLKSQREQKQLSLTLRGKIKFKVEEGYQTDINSHYIFVDDILTSGATAMASFNALKKPLKFAVYTILWRPKPE